MIVISDTSAISNLYQIGILDVLHQLFGDITITPAVKRELYAILEQGNKLDEIDWIIVKYPSDQKLISELLEILDLGEAESIALAIESNAKYLIIDEFKGREIATSYNLKIIGILGVLISAKKSGLLEEIGPKIKQLREIGFRLSLSLVNKVLAKLGEEEIR